MATVDAAFRQAAGVRSGDRVLVHAATGGVGLAAVQLLQVRPTPMTQLLSCQLLNCLLSLEAAAKCH